MTGKLGPETAVSSATAVNDEAVELVQRAAVAVFDGREAERIAVASGGVSNRSFRLEVSGRSYMLRLREPGTQALLSLAGEYEVLVAVAAAELGPRPAGFDDATGALAVEYVADAAPWNDATVVQQANIGRIAGLLRRLHALEARAHEFAPERYSQGYFDALGGRQALAREDGALAAELVELAAGYGGRFEGAALCHNDLVAANIIDGSRLLLVDFEFAVRSSPVLDLASLAVMNAYTQQQCAALIEIYHESRAVPFSRAEFAKVMRLQKLLGHFWARVRAREGNRASVARFLD